MPLSTAICAKSFSALSISCFAFSLLGLFSLLPFGDEQERTIDNSKKMLDPFFIMQLFNFFSNTNKGVLLPHKRVPIFIKLFPGYIDRFEMGPEIFYNQIVICPISIIFFPWHYHDSFSRTI